VAGAGNKRWWFAAGVVMTGLSAYFAVRMFGDDRQLFLPGATSHGHYQIEMKCEACHTEFGGVKQEACNKCHAEDLAAADDSHPRKKFEDPRNADRLEALDAMHCVTCHVEHRPERTRAMGVTLPDDYCVHCHAEVGTDRPSHRDFAFDTCASAGCHNFHDNKALYEDFLVKHLGEPALLPAARLPARDLRRWIEAAGKGLPARPLAAADADAPGPVDPAHRREWSATAHAAAGVNCRDCHAPAIASGERAAWNDHPGPKACAACHEREQQGFLGGRHGMRLAVDLPPMRPELARQPMKADAHGRELGCASCHGAHAFDTRRAAAESCLECHDDAHTRAWPDSPHARLWRAEVAGEGAPGSGVSCATCHLPREEARAGDLRGVRVQHNQNANLRPNEKMARGVCMRCHGLGFTLDALADPALVRANFAGQPARHVESLDLAAARLKQDRRSTPVSKPNP